MWAAGHADRVAGNVAYVTMQTDVLIFRQQNCTPQHDISHYRLQKYLLFIRLSYINDLYT